MDYSSPKADTLCLHVHDVILNIFFHFIITFTIYLLINKCSLNISRNSLSALQNTLSGVTTALHPIGSIPAFLYSARKISICDELIPEKTRSSAGKSAPLYLEPSFLNPVIPAIAPSFCP